MTHSRRNFLEELVAAGLLTGAVSTPVLGKQVVKSIVDAAPATETGANPGPPDPQAGPHDARQDFVNYFDSLAPASRGGPKVPLEAQEREALYLHYGPNYAGEDKKRLNSPNEITSGELFDHDGDVWVEGSVLQYRPGKDDTKLLNSVKSSFLRVEFIQKKRLWNYVPLMAWGGLLLLDHSTPNKIPAVTSLGFKPQNSTDNDGKVLLPGGLGNFAVKVGTVRPESTFHKILRTLVPAVIAAAPALSLPALAIPVLKTVQQMFLGPESESAKMAFLLNSNPSLWIATQQAALNEPSYQPLVQGNYVMVPKAHAEEFSQHKEDLVLDKTTGYLFSRKDSSSDLLPIKAGRTIPGVTYVTMSFKVTAAPAHPGAKPAAE